MKKRIVFLGLLSLTGLLKAQERYWTNFIDPDRVREIVEQDNYLFLPTSAGLIEVNLETGAFERWSKVNGLPSNWVMAVAFHPLSGDLYVGTFDKGIAVRRSGEDEWSLLPMPDAAINGTNTEYGVICMTFDAAGGLWIGSYRGAHYYNGTSWEKYNKTYGLATYFDDVYDIKVTETGDVYAASRGAFRLENGKWRNLGPLDESGDPLSDFSRTSLHIDEAGGLWYATGGGVIGYYYDNDWEMVEEFAGFAGSSFGRRVTLLEVAGSERPEILLHRNSWYHWKDEAWQPKDGVLGLRPKSGCVLNSGERVAVMEDHLVFEQGDSIVYNEYMFEGQAGGFVNSSDGALWGFDEKKLYNMLTGNTISYPTGARLGAQLYWKNAQFAPDGSLWSVNDHRVYRYEQQGWTVYDSTNSILPGEGDYWHLLEISPSGRVSFSAGDGGAYHFDGLDWHHSPESVLPPLEYWGHERTPQGLWVLAEFGSNGTLIPALWDGKDLKYGSNFDPDDAQSTFRLHYDPYRGWLWAAGNRSLLYFDGDSWHTYDLPDEEGFRISGIRDFIPGPDFLIIAEFLDLWIAHEGEWEVYNFENSPMYKGGIDKVGLDPEGGIWLTHTNFSMLPVNAVDRFQRFNPQEVIEQATIPDQLTVIGNPIQNGQLVLYRPQSFSSAATLQVFDATGRLVPVQPASIVGGFLRARVQGLAAGWYVAVVQDNGQRFTAPFVVGQ